MSAAAALVAGVGGAGGAGGGDGGGCPHGDTQSAPTLVQRSVSPSQTGKSPAHVDWLLCPLSHTLADGVRHLPKCGEQYSVSLHAVGGGAACPGDRVGALLGEQAADYSRLGADRRVVTALIEVRQQTPFRLGGAC